MTREDAEHLRSDDSHWSFGIVYHCREDPRIVVRNRWILGWTWNFSNPAVFPAILGAILLVLGPSLFLAARGGPAAGFVAAGVAVGVIVLLAHRNAIGPRL